MEALIAQDLFSEKHEQLLAPAFDAIAELVQKTWLPGASGAALAELLTVGAAGSKKPPRAPVRDARLRLDPLPWDELMSATRAALFERLDGGHPQAAAQSSPALRAWRDAHRIAQSPDGNLSLLAAVFDGHSRLWGALEVYPPVRVYLLARTLGHWCRMAIGLHEPHWAQAQAFCLRRSSFLRAVLAYGTAMLGRMIVPVHRQESPPKARRPGGAYRAPGEGGLEATRAMDPRVERLRGIGLERDLDAALAHAAVLAALSACGAPCLGDKWSWHVTSIRRIAERAEHASARLVAADPAAVSLYSRAGSLWAAVWSGACRWPRSPATERQLARPSRWLRPRSARSLGLTGTCGSSRPVWRPPSRPACCLAIEPWPRSSARWPSASRGRPSPRCTRRFARRTSRSWAPSGIASRPSERSR